jgi:NADP-dependent alcohol dehydrogenase
MTAMLSPPVEPNALIGSAAHRTNNANGRPLGHRSAGAVGAASWSCPTTVLSGYGMAQAWAMDRTESAITVIVDPAVAGDPTVMNVVESLDARAELRNVQLAGPVDLAGVRQLANTIGNSELVVGIGGGTIMDAVALSAATAADPAVSARLEVPERSGLVILAPSGRPTARTVLLPTTVGTGAEISSVACLPGRGGRRLIMGEALRPTTAVLDPMLTTGLPRHLLAEGILEALFRVTSPGLAGMEHRPVADALADALTGELTTCGESLVASGPSDPALRLRIAEASAATHASWNVLGLDPFGAVGWFLANQLSSETHVRKMTAVAALLPHLWRRVLGGDRRFGEAGCLHRQWRLIAGRVAGDLPSDPATGIAELIDHWGISAAIPQVGHYDVKRISRRTLRAWGAGLPMLGTLDPAAVRDVLTDTMSGGER